MGDQLQAAPAPAPAQAPEPAPEPQPPQRKGPALSPQAEQILAFADRPKGAIVKEFAFLLDVEYCTADYHCDKLVRARLLTKVKVRGEHAFRYWSNPAHALAYVEERAAQITQATEPAAAPAIPPAPFPELAPAAAPAVAALTPAEVKSAEVHASKIAASKKAPPPMGSRTERVKAGRENLTFTPPKIDDTAMRPKGEAIRTEQTVETRDTRVRPTAKWQMQDLPPDPRWPSFSSAPLGVNPDTGKAWEGRA